MSQEKSIRNDYNQPTTSVARGGKIANVDDVIFAKKTRMHFQLFLLR